MPETIFVKPAKERKVRNPKTGKHLPENGGKVELTAYWIRRLKVGDVEKATDTETKTKE